MKNNTLLKTNLLVCVIIIIGFAITSIISYRSNFGVFQRSVEMVSALSSEGLYNEITSIFSQPISVGITMANDSLLKKFLIDEQEHLSDEMWQGKMQEYLNAYRIRYNYDSVFLVSTATHNYYHYEGLNRKLLSDNPENTWYYRFLENNEEHSLNVDNDEATDNSITVFVNCKIKDENGATIGIVGVGLQVHSLQSLLRSYEEKYGVQAYLIDSNGIVQVSPLTTGHESRNLIDTKNYAENKSLILENKNTQEDFWYSTDTGDGYIVTQYEPNLKWHLVVENDTTIEDKKFSMQLIRNIIIIAVIVVLVLIIITTVMRRYNAQISKLTVSQELEYQRLLHEMTVGLYENIFELDITRNCAGGESTKRYFESLGIGGDAAYDKALHVIAGKQIKSEYIQGYLDTFSPNAVMESFMNGITNVGYDLMFSEDGKNYYWIRISARIFFWNSDKSVRMITYRQNIDAVKKRELLLLEKIQRDSMTGLYNKRITEEMIAEALKSGLSIGKCHAYLIIDIDNFKTVNDTMGHAYGDHVINEMAAEIKTQFRENDIVGRVGGDEFAVLMKNVDSIEGLKQKLARLCGRIGKKDFGEKKHLTISCSIGVALFPKDGTVYSELCEKADQALYHAKSHGKNSFIIFDDYADGYIFHSNQRDLESLMNVTTDGLAQYACTDPLKLLYFNQKCVELFGIPSAVLSEPDFDPLSVIHPDDVEEVYAAIKIATVERKTFARIFRIRHQEGHYMSVKLEGVFISQLYENKYPVFYVMYKKQDNNEKN